MATASTIKIPEVSDVDVAFGGNAMKLLPKMSELTAAENSGSDPACKAVQSIFFKGGDLASYGFTPKPGVELNKALRVIRTCLGSFEPKHEHKIGGVGHLVNQWFDYDPKKAVKK